MAAGGREMTGDVVIPGAMVWKDAAAGIGEAAMTAEGWLCQGYRDPGSFR